MLLLLLGLGSQSPRMVSSLPGDKSFRSSGWRNQPSIVHLAFGGVSNSMRGIFLSVITLLILPEISMMLPPYFLLASFGVLWYSCLSSVAVTVPAMGRVGGPAGPL